MKLQVVHHVHRHARVEPLVDHLGGDAGALHGDDQQHHFQHAAMEAPGRVQDFVEQHAAAEQRRSGLERRGGDHGDGDQRRRPPVWAQVAEHAEEQAAFVDASRADGAVLIGVAQAAVRAGLLAHRLGGRRLAAGLQRGDGAGELPELAGATVAEAEQQPLVPFDAGAVRLRVRP